MNELDKRISRLAKDPKLDNISFKFYVEQFWSLLGFLSAMDDLDEWAVQGINYVLDLMELESMDEAISC